MKLQSLETGKHQLKQYVFRINEKELEALLVVAEFANSSLTKSPSTPVLKELRKNINTVKRGVRTALREQE